ncbi:hypothetical protein OKW41_006144 [Paraburkholderia sp. UCT70]|uniref:hypothetical protein n=1 Tax=Paraburkholderia sp. UCT70 TaxID=2991068 RepID=UPI003D1B969F
MRRPIVFIKKAAAPAAVPARPVLFVTPVTYLLDSGPDPEAPMSSAVLGVLAKAALDAEEGAFTYAGATHAREAREALALGAAAWLEGRPVPADLRWAAWNAHNGVLVQQRGE